MFLSREEEERSQQEGGSGPGLDQETGGPTFSSDEDEEDEDRDEIIHLIQPQEVHNFYACKLIDTVDVVIMGFWYYLNSFFMYVLIHMYEFLYYILNLNLIIHFCLNL